MCVRGGWGENGRGGGWRTGAWIWRRVGIVWWEVYIGVLERKVSLPEVGSFMMHSDCHFCGFSCQHTLSCMGWGEKAGV